MSGHCKDCQFWGVYREGACDRYGWTNDGDSGFDLVATADDDQGLSVALVTGPNFGCVKFQHKA